MSSDGIKEVQTTAVVAAAAASEAATTGAAVIEAAADFLARRYFCLLGCSLSLFAI